MLPAFTPSRSRLVEDKLIFDTGNLLTALREGCFALQIPQNLDLQPGIRLAREFYREPESQAPFAKSGYRGFRSRKDIYFDRDHFQTEHLLLDGVKRSIELPDLVNRMCEQMCAIGCLILREILALTGIAEPLWQQATDHCCDQGGVQWLAVSHYRSDRALPGAPAHKDTGFVTVLYYDQPGLEAHIKGAWCDVAPLAGHFLVNFGGALETLTACLPIQAVAVLHRVRRCYAETQAQDRFSFATFLNPAATGEVYQASSDGQSLASLGSVEAFLREFNASTWRDDYADFGITEKEPAPPDTEAER